MGGPVYLYFSDDSGVQQTSGENKLVTETPEDWDYLYPGMNIHFEAKAVLQGHKWINEKPSGEEVEVITTGAILRARIMLEVFEPDGSTNTSITRDIYSWIWPQLKAKATADKTTNTGMWVFDEIDEVTPENNYFYYVNQDQTYANSGDYYLTEIGGVETNEAVGFLNNAVITLPGVTLTNEHADCRIKFTIVFHGLQGFIPYEEEDLGTPYLGDISNGRPNVVVENDLGMPKPLTVENSRRVFEEAFSALYPGEAPVEPTI